MAHDDAAGGPVESISAITLAVSDMAASFRFYRAAGFACTVGGADAPFTTLRAGRGFVNLQVDPDHAPVRSIWGRVIFWVDDVDAMWRRLADAGYPSATDPADAPWGERYFHIHDPDGHELSFARPLDDRT